MKVVELEVIGWSHGVAPDGITVLEVVWVPEDQVNLIVSPKCTLGIEFGVNTKLATVILCVVASELNAMQKIAANKSSLVFIKTVLVVKYLVK